MALIAALRYDGDGWSVGHEMGCAVRFAGVLRIELASEVGDLGICQVSGKSTMLSDVKVFLGAWSTRRSVTRNRNGTFKDKMIEQLPMTTPALSPY